MKKITVFALVVALVFGLGSCSNSNDSDDASTPSSALDEFLTPSLDTSSATETVTSQNDITFAEGTWIIEEISSREFSGAAEITKTTTESTYSSNDNFKTTKATTIKIMEYRGEITTETKDETERYSTLSLLDSSTIKSMLYPSNDKLYSDDDITCKKSSDNKVYYSTYKYEGNDVLAGDYTATTKISAVCK